MSVNGLGLLVGHLLGDYVLQNDWQARWKSAAAGTLSAEENALLAVMHGDRRVDRLLGRGPARRPFLACTLHCGLYTIAVWCCSAAWMPWWGLLACFAAHWPIDRWRLARRLMILNGQREFATGPLSPWSVIVVDNTLHLLTLYVIALIAEA